jgi:hypothetical protein
MKKLKDLGFKKVRGTEPGFVMYELNASWNSGPDKGFTTI